ncbi:TPA: hypothetical protein OZR47_000312 [Escherichia coli]|nr:hypothetical protein [Escherichia coli]HBS6100316.1 hypothetical protein [Klebsiella variicola]HCX4105158.1 hypothetical protein [Escherichia coli]
MKHNRITGEIDGTPQEITDFYQNMGFNSSDVFQTKGKTFFSLFPAIVFAISCISMLFFDLALMGDRIFTAEVIIVIFVALWFCAATQHYYKNWLVTVIIAIGCLLMLLLATKQISLSTISALSQDAAKSYLQKDPKGK